MQSDCSPDSYIAAWAIRISEFDFGGEDTQEAKNAHQVNGRGLSGSQDPFCEGQVTLVNCPRNRTRWCTLSATLLRGQ